jgi:hypothetical protein
MASFTQDKGLALFNPGHRNEKYLKIMIDTLVISLVQATDGATPWILVKHLRFRGYADYKEHDQGSKVQGSKVQGYFFLCSLYYNPLIPEFANSK